MRDERRTVDDSAIDLAVAGATLPGAISALFNGLWLFASIGVVTMVFWGYTGATGRMSRKKRLGFALPGMLTMTAYYVFFRH